MCTCENSYSSLWILLIVHVHKDLLRSIDTPCGLKWKWISERTLKKTRASQTCSKTQVKLMNIILSVREYVLNIHPKSNKWKL